MALDPNNITIVHWYPDQEKHKCGYCKDKTGSVSYGMWVETMTVDDYQNLIDRGWRRSGKYCYKPIMKETCCPQYTIRCDSTNFKPSKSQKKIIKKFNKYLQDGVLPKTTPQPMAAEDTYTLTVPRERPSFDLLLNQEIEGLEESGEVQEKKRKPDEAYEVPETTATTSAPSAVEERQATPIKTVKSGEGADPDKPPCKKAKLLRIERKQQKMKENGMDVEARAARKEASGEKSLAELLEAANGGGSGRRLRVELVETGADPCEGWEATREAEYELYRSYQMAVHGDPPDKCTMRGYVRCLVSSPLKVELVQMSLEHDLFQLTAALFAKYQMAVHNESRFDCSEDSFYEFLVSSPLKNKTDCTRNGIVKYGSFHQQYWLDDKLIAVGVIDVLPRCISSVYFFYDPDYRALTLGTYGALREIHHITTLTPMAPSLRFYYMGFYIHSCPKMRYKGHYNPSYLLCPETYEWFPIRHCVPKLDANKYSRLNDDGSAVDVKRCRPEDLDSLNVYVGRGFCKYRHYQFRARYADVFENIGMLVGRVCVKSLLVVSPHRSQ